MTRTRIASLLAVLVAAAACGTAAADVITFGTRNLDHLSAAGTQTEGAYQYSASGLAWELETLRANPGAALATFFDVEGSAVGEKVDIVKVGGGRFSFTSIDWSTFGANSGDDVVIEGFLGATLVDSLSLTGESAAWNTASGFGGDLDLLSIRVTAKGPSFAMALDNIVLGSASSVPEPGALGLAGLALAGLALARRRAG